MSPWCTRPPRQLGFPALLGPACRERDLAYALIISRVVAPRPKLATLAWWGDVTLGPDLGIADAPRDDVYEAMDWLLEQPGRHRGAAGRPAPARGRHRHVRPVLVLGGGQPLRAGRPRVTPGTARRAGSRSSTGCSPTTQGRPVAIRVFAGNTADPTAFIQAVEWSAAKFDLARDGHGRRPGDDHLGADPGAARTWAACRGSPACARRRSVSSPTERPAAAVACSIRQDLAEITSPDYPGERLIACRNPLLAAERARKRDDLLAATETLLATLKDQRPPGRIRGADKIGVRAGKVINRYKVAKHFILDIGDDRFGPGGATRPPSTPRPPWTAIYIIRTPVPAAELDAPATVAAYKNLARVERDFRSLKADDLDLRPICHWLEDRVRGHVLICMLAAYLTWHLRAALAPLTYTDEQPPARPSPVAPARRSAHADAKAATHTSPAGQPLRSFRGLLDHLATLTRSTIRLGDITFEKISDPTPAQRRAFDLIGAPIPQTLTLK